MSEKREMPHPMDSNEREAELSRAEINAEEEDVYAQLAQKEQDLILAAELGKALLDSNQDLQSRFDHMVDDFTHKVEGLQQEKYDLHLELEKMQAEYKNAIKDLQDDVTALSKQARASDEYQVSERERSRSLREALQNSDYLSEQVKKASLKEEELMKELNQLKMRNESNSATIKDQMDHISMLRDQVEYLSEKLLETNQKLEEILGEKDILVNTLEMTQENSQIMEMKLSEQEVKIQRQANDIEELQESNSELLQQLQQKPRAPYIGRSGNTTRHNNFTSSGQKPQKLYFEINQEKQKQSHLYPQSQQLSRVDHQQHKLYQGTHANKQFDECDEVDQVGGIRKLHEQSLFAELTLGDNGGTNQSHPFLTEFSSICHHNRSAGDCHICFVTEGSRKRHHQNIGGGSDDDEANDSGPKQSLYADSYDPHGGSASSAIDSNGNKLSYLISSQFETHNPCQLEARSQSASAELFQRRNTHAVLPDSPPLSASESFPKSCLSHNSCKENETFVDIQSQLEEDTSFSCGENEKTLFSELSQYAHEFYPKQQDAQEQSLFSELSTQLYDDRNGTGSDSSSNCMLGVFDFSGSDAQDVDRNSNESLNRSMEIRSRIESDMSCVSDWYYMTPVTSEMLEEDDFECDDDDFLIGNMAGTTLSISGIDHGLRYHYHGYIPGEDITDPDLGSYGVNEISCNKEPGSKGHNNQQAQLSEACRQLKELVIRVQGEGCASITKELGPCEDYWEADTDILLSLVAEMKVCVDKLTTHKEKQLQDADISTTIKDEAGITDRACKTEGLQILNTTEKLLQQQDQDVGKQQSFADNGKDHRNGARKQMKKSKSSSSLV